MKNIFFILVAFLSLFYSCNKSQSVSPKVDTKVNSEKITRNSPYSSMLLIPAGYTARVGFIGDGGIYHLGFSLTNLDIITGGDDGPTPIPPYHYDIVNPGGFAGLPNLISGVVLTGISTTGIYNAGIPEIYLSYTDAFDHYLLTAQNTILGTGEPAYEIVSAVQLNSPLTLASNGWVLHDIEISQTGVTSGNLYGLFSGPSSNSTILAEIDPVTGNCTSLNTFGNQRCCGLEILNDRAYLLLYEDINATTYGKILVYDINLPSVISLDLAISKTNPSYSYNLNWGIVNYDRDFFLSFYPTGAGRISIYNSGNSVANLLKYNVAIPLTPASTGSNNAYWYDVTNNTFKSPAIGYIITDAAN